MEPPGGKPDVSGDPGTGVVTVLMTAPGTESAEAVTRALVEERLVACGNIIPGAVSVYRWKGEVQRDEEVVVILKTTCDRLPRALERAAELHPYDVPELLAQEVAEGAPAYLAWVRGECRAGPEAAP